MAETIERRIWLCLRDQGPLPPDAIAKALRLTLKQVHHGLSRLSSRIVRDAGSYTVAPESQAPIDGRPLNGDLARGRDIGLAKIKAMRDKGIIHPRPIPKTTLEQTWGWMSPLNELNDDSEVV